MARRKVKFIGLVLRCSMCIKKLDSLKIDELVKSKIDG